jgi:hypothetical protein
MVRYDLQEARVMFPLPQVVHPEGPGQPNQVTATQHQVREMVCKNIRTR